MALCRCAVQDSDAHRSQHRSGVAVTAQRPSLKRIESSQSRLTGDLWLAVTGSQRTNQDAVPRSAKERDSGAFNKIWSLQMADPSQRASNQFQLAKARSMLNCPLLHPHLRRRCLADRLTLDW